MPLPSFVISVNLFLCEKVLQEADGVLSAIRIVDVFRVPHEPPPEAFDLQPGDPVPLGTPMVMAWALVSISASVGHIGRHSIDLRIINTAGELKPLIAPQEYTFTTRDQQSPAGIGFAAHIGLVVRRLGVCYLCLFLDDGEIARTPITVTVPEGQ